LRRFLPESLNRTAETPPSGTAADFRLDEFLRDRLRPDANDLYAETHQQLDRLLLTQVLTYSRGNIRQGARLLGIARQTLRLKLREAGLQVNRSINAEEEDWAIRGVNRLRRDSSAPRALDSARV
jgi:two-component system nitrogen regulation response regulator GlnG